MSRDVQFDDDRALRRPIDLPVEHQPTKELRVKLEETDVQVLV